MKEKDIRTIFNAEKDFTSDSEEFYKNYWTTDGSVKPEAFSRNRAKIEKFFPEGLKHKSILEVGVGGEGGIIISLMTENEVFGLDVSESAVNNCKKFGLNVQKLNLDKEPVPFKDDTFDVVFAFEVFEHFSNPQYAIEELKRVLKPSGRLLVSIPSVLTYHWPRLFYPGLFEKKHFTEFLMVNGFYPRFENDWLMKNFFRNYNISEDLKSWSWYFLSEKIPADDISRLFDIGLYFWNQKNNHNLRLKPVEALDFFSKCYRLKPQSYPVKFFYSLALLYRAMGDDQDAADEYNRLVKEVLPIPQMKDLNEELSYLKAVFEMHLEITKIGNSVFSEKYIKMVIERIIFIDANYKEYFGSFS